MIRNYDTKLSQLSIFVLWHGKWRKEVRYVWLCWLHSMSTVILLSHDWLQAPGLLLPYSALHWCGVKGTETESLTLSIANISPSSGGEKAGLRNLVIEWYLAGWLCRSWGHLPMTGTVSQPQSRSHWSHPGCTSTPDLAGPANTCLPPLVQPGGEIQRTQLAPPSSHVLPGQDTGLLAPGRTRSQQSTSHHHSVHPPSHTTVIPVSPYPRISRLPVGAQ